MTTPTRPTYTWRCTSCPKEQRVSVETSDDVAPVCPRCKKIMKVSDCCGCGESHLGNVQEMLIEAEKREEPKKSFLGRRKLMDRAFRDVEPWKQWDGPLIVPERLYQTTLTHTMTEEELDTPRPFGYYPPTTIDRRLDDTERMVDLLVERLGRVTVLPDDTEAGVRSAMSEQIDRINGKLGVLLGGLDLS